MRKSMKMQTDMPVGFYPAPYWSLPHYKSQSHSRERLFGLHRIQPIAWRISDCWFSAHLFQPKGKFERKLFSTSKRVDFRKENYFTLWLRQEVGKTLTLNILFDGLKFKVSECKVWNAKDESIYCCHRWWSWCKPVCTLETCCCSERTVNVTWPDFRFSLWLWIYLFLSFFRTFYTHKWRFKQDIIVQNIVQAYY